MPQCPKCSAALQEDYGMVSCPSCGSFLFIDMEGIAHMGDESAKGGGSSQDLDHEIEPVAFDQGLEEPFPAEVSPIISEADFSADLPEPSPPMMETDHQVNEVEQDASPFSESPSEFNMDSLLGYQTVDGANEGVAPGVVQGVESNTSDLGASDQPGPPGDPLGISGYANSEISQAKDGLLMFKILILGIDTKEIRESLREAIQDVRFGWDPGEIMARISKGTLEIENVSPVKASILVNRIKRLPIRIRWEQYAITQIDEN